MFHEGGFYDVAFSLIQDQDLCMVHDILLGTMGEQETTLLEPISLKDNSDSAAPFRLSHALPFQTCKVINL